MARPTGRPVREEVIAAATLLVKQVGVSAFSFGGLAKQLGIKAPSIHHHFRTKEDLVTAIAERYRLEFADAVAAIPEGTAQHRLEAYAELFARTAQADQLCLCGAVAAEWLSVGEGPRREVATFFSDQVAWLESQIVVGIDSGSIRADVDAAQVARLIFASLEGSMLMTRAGSAGDLAAQLGSLLFSMVEAA